MALTRADVLFAVKTGAFDSTTATVKSFFTSSAARVSPTIPPPIMTAEYDFIVFSAINVAIYPQYPWCVLPIYFSADELNPRRVSRVRANCQSTVIQTQQLIDR